MINYLLPILAYFMGSISSAVVVSKLMGLQDPRSAGSGNPGATNMLRVGGKKAAAITLLGDILKGMVPVAIAHVVTTDPLILALVAFMAFLGHLFPLFFGFHGGKGVATAFGALVALSPWVGLALVITWSVIAAMFRYSSLSAVTAALLAPAYVWLLLPARPYFYITLAMAALLLWRHRSNIRNLLAGTEGKIGH
jgi:acyl phosphate:glycerol-3-phosphate acyltransferase